MIICIIGLFIFALLMLFIGWAIARNSGRIEKKQEEFYDIND